MAPDETPDVTNGEVKKVLKKFTLGPTIIANEKTDDEGHSDEEYDSYDDTSEMLFGKGGPAPPDETTGEFIRRHYGNLKHFLVEDWALSAVLGVVTAVLSIGVDIAIEYIAHLRIVLYEAALSRHIYSALASWTCFSVVLVFAGSLFCHAVSKHAVGSGIPELKVIMHGYDLKNYLTLKTLVAKVVGLIFALAGGLPLGKEGPFVHMGAIVASLLNEATSSCRYNTYFSNEGRRMEMLSSGCAVGIACTFSAPAGGVLYGIESTSKYFRIQNYWRSFFATTCSAIIFRFACYVIVPPEIAGTITAYYQTSFPNEVFVVEEIPFFIFLGAICGLFSAAFVWLNRRVAMFKRKNRVFVALFGKRPILFTVLFAALVAIITFPDGTGQYFAGKFSFRETLSDFIANCTIAAGNDSAVRCPQKIIDRWTGKDGELNPFMTLTLYNMLYYVLVSVCVTLYLPAGIFVPAFVFGAGTGRILGEVINLYWPMGMRGLGGPRIFPGLYAVVGAAAYTGAVTHSLSIAVIVCETTGQLCALLPVLIALMIANAICSFLQPSIYESIININGYPYLNDLPPSRVSVHTLTVDKVMIRDLHFVSNDMTYGELKQMLKETPTLKSFPYVTDKESMILIGSVSRKYLTFLLFRKFGPDSTDDLMTEKPKWGTELFNVPSFRRSSQLGESLLLTGRHISGNSLLPMSPLHNDETVTKLTCHQSKPLQCQSCVAMRMELWNHLIEIDDAAIDPAPFQLVKRTSLLKVHNLFTLLALNYAYVTDKGRLVGVVAVKDLRETFSNIYSRGAQPPALMRRQSSLRRKSATNKSTTSQENIEISPPSSPSAFSPEPNPLVHIDDTTTETTDSPTAPMLELKSVE